MLVSLFFITFSLLSWGWLSETWLVTSMLLSIILFSQITSWRWQVTQNQFYRWGDLSSLLIVLMVAYVYLIESVSRQPIFIVLKWLPVLFSPILFVQLFSQQQQLPLGTLFYSMRKRSNKMIDFQTPYAALTLLATGAANHQNTIYYLVVIIFFAGILFVSRPLKNSKIIWIILILIAMGGGYFGYQSLRQFHYWMEDKTVEWFSSWNTDPFKGQTSIGDLGSLKLSNKIEFRVKSDEPLLLHQASYDVYLGQNWLASKRIFSFNNPVNNSQKLRLKKIEFVQEFNNKEILALPDGTVKIQGLEGANLEYTELGAVKISDAPSLGNFQVFYTNVRQNPTSEYDLKVPKQHQDWLLAFNNNLKLEGLSPQKIADKIKGNFHQNFYYSLYLGNESDRDLALKDFILKRKAGHCEYFAVATVLLLRQAGVPARLANGYVASEYNKKQQHYIVRRRHAHAWAIAYINGVWEAVDSTPPRWLAMEADNASGLQPLNDWFADTLLAFKQWRIQRIENDDAPLWWGAAVLLLLYLLLRIYSARPQLNRKKTINQKNNKVTYRGEDSAFYLIDTYFKGTSNARDENESIQQWVERIGFSELQALYLLHYQLRFDPLSLSSFDKKQLEKKVMLWLKDKN